MRRSKALAMVFLAATFIVGVAAGVTVDRTVVRDSCRSSSDRGSLRDYLGTQLQLSEAQRAAVDSILDKRHHDMSAVLDPVRPQLDSIRVAARGEIFKVLDSRQDSLFQQMIDESQRNKAKAEARRK